MVEMILVMVLLSVLFWLVFPRSWALAWTAALAIGFVLGLAGVPVAFAQDAPAVPADPDWLGYLLMALGTVGGASIVSAFIKTKDRWWMKIIDAIAFNWLRARNDPRADED